MVGVGWIHVSQPTNMFDLKFKIEFENLIHIKSFSHTKAQIVLCSTHCVVTTKNILVGVIGDEAGYILNISMVFYGLSFTKVLLCLCLFCCVSK